MRAELPKWILTALLLMASAGCRVTDSDVQTWKGTVKGPSKMVAVLLADKYDLQLRTQAGLALVEMRRSDLDGVQELLSALQKLDRDTRDKIISGLAPGLEKLMQEGKTEPGVEPLAGQVRAKDAAFALVGMSEPEARKQLTRIVMSWYVADFDGRSLSGAYSAEQVVRALGASAASTLVDALGARSPQQALIKLAELISQVGDAETKQRAAHRLVEIEQEMMSEPFVAWLRGQITAQLSTGGAAPPADRVNASAILNRDKFIDEGVLPAMKYLAEQPEIANRLLAIAKDPNPALALRRTRALQALEGKAREEHLDALMQLALDPTAPSSVRDYAFDRVGDTRSVRAIPSLWPLVQDAKDQRLRWRAGELVLALGGNNVLAEFFAKLPTGADVKYEPEELEGYALRLGQMTPLPRAVASAQLGSPHWFGRVIGLQVFARKGVQADLSALERLSGDSAPTKGEHWPKDFTVGKVASQAIAGLRERLAQGQGGPQAAAP
jgi:hypothetical protein